MAKRKRGRPRNPDKGGHTLDEIYWITLDFYRLQSEKPDAGPYSIVRGMSKEEFYKSRGHTYDSLAGLVLKQSAKPHVALGILGESTKQLTEMRDHFSKLPQHPERDRIIARIDEILSYPQVTSGNSEGQKR